MVSCRLRSPLAAASAEVPASLAEPSSACSVETLDPIRAASNPSDWENFAQSETILPKPATLSAPPSAPSGASAVVRRVPVRAAELPSWTTAFDNRVTPDASDSLASERPTWRAGAVIPASLRATASIAFEVLSTALILTTRLAGIAHFSEPAAISAHKARSERLKPNASAGDHPKNRVSRPTMRRQSLGRPR